MLLTVGLGGVAEAPALHPSGDLGLVGVVDAQAGGGEDPAVVCATRPRAMLVDRALVVDQHRAMPSLVVADDDVAGRQSGCREQQLGRNVGDRVGLVGADVDELRRGAARGAAVARHVGSVFTSDRALDLDHPRREVARRQVAVGVHAGARKHAASGGMSIASDTSWPCAATSSVWTRSFPMPLPPNRWSSPLRSIDHSPATGTPMR